MKKSLVALAVLAASGAAMAQSSVTLYGVADLWMGSVNVENSGKSTRTTYMVNGGVLTSRWGMKGSEDLGGGLKANFNFETAVGMDDGSSTGFSRQAWVGFSGGFGEVKLGKTGTAFDNLNGSVDAVFNSDLSPGVDASGAAFKGTGVMRTFNESTGKTNNNIHYQAPNFSGFTGAVSYALAEDPNTTPTTVVTAVTAFNVKYAGGPLAAYLAYEKQDVNNSDNDKALTQVGGSYNFGMATAKATFGKVDKTNGTANGSTTEWTVGADFPVSAALTLSAGYHSSTDNADSAALGIGEVKRSGFGFAGAYALSKRTTVYGGFKKVNLDNGTAADTDVSVIAAGVLHTF